MYRFASVTSATLQVFSEAVSTGLGDTMEIGGKDKAWSLMTKVPSLFERMVVT